ncbi:hypothetical protein AJ87_09325 [Rhizobium yanglingense]|nr:hypothetical protein AJ87_09325 [Rhizobium yanglingense]
MELCVNACGFAPLTIVQVIQLRHGQLRSGRHRALSFALGPRLDVERVALDFAKGIPGGPINSVAEAIDDPQIKARGLKIAPEGLPGLRTPISLSRSPLTLDRASPILVADTGAFPPKRQTQNGSRDRWSGRRRPAAAKVSRPPSSVTATQKGCVRIAFDGDSVIFSSEADLICRRDGRAAFFEHERDNATNPIAPGPFGKFFQKLSLLRHACQENGEGHKVTAAIITARTRPLMCE